MVDRPPRSSAERQIIQSLLDEPSSTVSYMPTEPPAYSVEENSKGELMNYRLNLKWPDWPPRKTRCNTMTSTPVTTPSEISSISTESLVKTPRKQRACQTESKTWYICEDAKCTKQHIDAGSVTIQDETSLHIDSLIFGSSEELEEYRRKKEGNVKSARSEKETSKSSMMSDRSMAVTAKVFKGMRSRATINRKLLPGRFYIYYDKPRNSSEILCTPLLRIALMNSAKQIVHYPIQQIQMDVFKENRFIIQVNEIDAKVFETIDELTDFFCFTENVDSMFNNGPC